MAYGNVMTIAGNLARDPELRFTGAGTAYCKTAVAIYAGKDSNGNEKPAHFVDLTIWGDQAQNAADSFKKGDRVLVLGAIQQDRWETSEGQKRSKLTMNVEEIAGSARWASVTVNRTPRDGDFEAPDEAPF